MEPVTLGSLKLGLAIVVAALSVRYLKERIRRKGRSLPPGPRGYPLIGNALALPQERAWLTYAEWSKQYGDVLYLDALGQPIIILGSLQAATDMFEKKGANVSDRPRSVMLDLCGMSWPFFALPYGDAWRVRRRAFHVVNLADQVVEYQAGQLADAHILLKNLVDDPKQFIAATREFLGSSSMRTTYGIKVKGSDDPLLVDSEHAGALTSDAALPGRWMAESLPWMRFIPSWVPGAAFARLGDELRASGRTTFRDRPWAAMEAAQARDEAVPSMATRMLEHLADEPNRLQIAMDAAGNAMLGGADTSVAAIMNFFHAMALHPEAQTKAQTEIDAVVGRDRLPDFNDRDNLPYVDALLRETLRWQVITPFALPRATLSDMEYKGFFIAKNTIVMANSWAILHDSDMYDEPESFKPERFLRTNPDGSSSINPDVYDPRDAIFGYGRRMCPGKPTATALLYIAAVSILATMRVSRPTDARGAPAPMHEEWVPGILNAFAKFDCTILPRDKRAAELVREAAEMAEGQS